MELKDGKKINTLMGVSVSIAPLWNWKKASIMPPSALTGFNRTFMELKEECRAQFRQICDSFNRTFMELKELKTLFSRKGFVFQSHLYGIERITRTKFKVHKWVSIAPLWNWKHTHTHTHSFNRTFMELKEKSTHLMLIIILFQSHLYGIERQERWTYDYS